MLADRWHGRQVWVARDGGESITVIVEDDRGQKVMLLTAAYWNTANSGRGARLAAGRMREVFGKFARRFPNVPVVYGGDLNARSRDWCQMDNANGRQLRDVVQELGLLASVKLCGKATRRIGDKVSCIDHVLMHGVHCLNANVDVKHDARFRVSDHSAVVVVLQLALANTVVWQGRRRIRWARLEEEKVQAQVAQRFSVHYQRMMDTMDKQDMGAEGTYLRAAQMVEAMTASLEEITGDCVGWARKRSGEHEVPRWLTATIVDLTKAKRRLRNRATRHAASAAERKELVRLTKEIKRVVKRAKRLHWEGVQSLAAQLAQHGDTRAVWRVVRGRRAPDAQVDPQHLSNHLQNVAAGAVHPDFDEAARARKETEVALMLRNSDRNEQCPELDVPPSISEVKDIIDKLSKGKATEDGVPVEILQLGGASAVAMVHATLDALWKAAVVPDELKTGVIIALPKKGDLTDPNNYRAITLQPVICKVFDTLCRDRITARVDGRDGRWLKDDQGGFRVGRGCTQQALVLRAVLESERKSKVDTIVAFLDVSRAYDSAWRPAVLEALVKAGCGGRMAQMIGSRLTGTSARISVGGRMTDTFAVREGTPQGSTVSPVLFAIFLQHVMEVLYQNIEYEELCRMAGVDGEQTQYVFLLLFADDAVLVARSTAAMQVMLTKLCTASNEFRFRFHPGKCVAMVVSSRKLTVDQMKLEYGMLKVYDEEVAWSVQAKYLGMEFSAHHDAQRHAASRTKAARGALKKMASNVSVFRGAVPNTALSVLLATVLPVVTYGCEVFPYNGAWRSKLQAVMNDGAKMALGAYRSTPTWLLHLEAGMTPVDFVVATRLLVEVVKACMAPPNDRTRVAVKLMMQQRMTGGYGWYVAWAATLLDMAGMQGLKDVMQTSGTCKVAVRRVKLLSRQAIGKHHRRMIRDNAGDLVVQHVWNRIEEKVQEDEALEEIVRKRPMYLRSTEQRSRFTWIVRSDRWSPKSAAQQVMADCWLCGEFRGDHSDHMLFECTDPDITEWKEEVWRVCSDTPQVQQWITKEEVSDEAVLMAAAPSDPALATAWGKSVRPLLAEMHAAMWSKRRLCRRSHAAV